MKKRILSIILALCMVICFVPTGVFAEGETPKEVKVADEDEILTALADSTVDIITLKNDIAISTTLTVDRKVTLDLVGYMLEMTGSGSVIKVKSGGHLTLKDSDLTSTYYFTPEADGLWKWGTTGTKTVNGGVIYGGNAEIGGGVYIEPGGQFTMKGGSIVGCIANDRGGGVMVDCDETKGSSFTMKSGAIIGCVAKGHGGGVETQANGVGNELQGAFIMDGGVIEYCVANKYGGICCSGSFTMNGGTIRYCRATEGTDPAEQRGGVYLAGRGQNILNGTIISEDAVDTQYVFAPAPVTIGADADIRANMYLNGYTIALADGVTSKTIYGKITNGRYADGLVAVTYKVNGEDYATQFLQSGSAATRPADPAVTGSYEFDGWFRADGTRWDYSNDTVTENITLTGYSYLHVIDENTLTDALGGSAEVIRLTEDIDISASLTILRKVTLDLNGHVLKMTGSGSVIKVNVNGNLTLIDSNITSAHYFTPNADGLWVSDETGGTEIINGGVITGGTGTVTRYFALGGGVYVDGGGRFTMTGGNIVGCTAKGSYGISAMGGGVYVAANGTFTMTGGSITGCTAAAPATLAYGGGIRNDGERNGDIGRITLSGTAVIRNCHAKDASYLFGGGISDAGTLTISGNVKIIGCTAGGKGTDAMYVNANNGSSITGGTFYGSIKDPGNKIHGLTVTYHLNNDKNYATQVLQSGDQITLPDPAKPGYAFDGWYKDGTKWDKTTLVTENLTLTGWLYAPVASESELTAALADSSIDVIRLASDIKLSNELQITNNRKVTLDLNGYVLDPGGKYILVSALSGDPWYHLNQLTIIDSDPTKPHKFTDNDGLWKLDENGDKTVSGGIITGDSDDISAITAGSRGIVTMNGGNIVGCSTSGVGGAVSARNGTFIMNGGSIIGCKTDFAGGAVYVLNGNFIMNSGSITNCVVTSPAGDGGAVYVSTDGTFTMNGGSIADCTAVNGSALYLKNGTMNAGGGTVGGTVVLERNSTIQGSDSTFSGLIINNDAQTQFSGAHSPLGIVGEEPVGANGYSYHKVAFDTAGGNMSHTTRYFLQGKDISNEIKPAPRTGYTFGGWYKADGTAWDYASDKVTDNITLYAKWTANTYTITFDSTGGSEVTTKTIDVTYGEPLGDMPVPIRMGYFFRGWYDAPADGKCYGGSDGKSTSQYDKTENCTLYAHWKINQYTITFDTAGGSKIDSITQDYGTQITTPANPTREGYTFIGWDKEIPATMPAENMTLKARWKDIEKPTGEIIIGTNKWREFLNKLTFDLFFKDTQTVTITAADNSGTVFISYLVTDQDLSEAELQSLVFSGYEEPFCIDPNGEYIVYAMLVDESMNITYLRSDRVTLDNVQPVIDGIENGKIYCEAQTVTINEKYIDTVTVNDTEVTLDENNSFVLSPADGKQKIVAVDKTGNTAEMTVTVNDGHTALTDDSDCTTPVCCKFCGAEVIAAKSHDFSSSWHNDENFHWHVCQNENCAVTDTKTAHSENDDGDCTTTVMCECGYIITAAKNAHSLGEWSPNGDGTHTRNCTTDGCTAGTETENCEDADKDHSCDICGKALSECADTDNDHNCDICGKTLSVHTGGTATCKNKAICEICKSSYGETNEKNHASLRKIDAKAATKEAEGNIEYWHCEGCGKYYSDKDGANEIAKADAVTKRLAESKPESADKSPQTGDTSVLVLWLAILMLCSGAAVFTLANSKHKKRFKK